MLSWLLSFEYKLRSYLEEMAVSQQLEAHKINHEDHTWL